MKKFLATALSAALTVTLLAGCSGSNNNQNQNNNDNNNQPQGGDTVKIGVLAPLTGEVSVYGVATANGIKLAADEINKNGGIGGKQVELVIEDEKGDATEALNAYNKMVSDIVALIGDVTSGPTQAVADVAVNDGIPMLTATGTAASITQTGDNIFRTCFIDPFQGQIMGKFAVENLKVKTVAVMSNSGSDYSQGVAKAFIETVEAAGVQVVANESFGDADKDFNVQVTKIAAANPDVLFVPDYYQKIALIAAQARKAGYTNPMMGPDGWDGVLGVVTDPTIVDNCYFSNHYSPADEDETVQNFLKNYKATYNEDPNSFAALGYDSMYIMKAAIEKAGSTDSDAVVKALAETDFTGVTGHITFDENGDPIKSTAVTKLIGGEAVLETKLSLD